MAVVLVVLSVLGLVVAGSVQPLSEEAGLAAVRVETTRAFFAAESGVFVVIGLVNAGHDPPGTGDETRIGSQTIRYVQVPEDSGDLVIEGASGLATRRVQLTIE